MRPVCAKESNAAVSAIALRLNSLPILDVSGYLASHRNSTTNNKFKLKKKNSFGKALNVRVAARREARLAIISIQAVNKNKNEQDYCRSRMSTSQ